MAHVTIRMDADVDGVVCAHVDYTVGKIYTPAYATRQNEACLASLAGKAGIILACGEDTSTHQMVADGGSYGDVGKALMKQDYFNHHRVEKPSLFVYVPQVSALEQDVFFGVARLDDLFDCLLAKLREAGYTIEEEAGSGQEPSFEGMAELLNMLLHFIQLLGVNAGVLKTKGASWEQKKEKDALRRETSPKPLQKRWYMKGATYDAVMEIRGANQFVVLAGSRIDPRCGCETTKQEMIRYIESSRAHAHIEEGVLTKDLELNSPTHAATCVFGNFAGGLYHWRTSTRANAKNLRECLAPYKRQGVKSIVEYVNRFGAPQV